MSRDRASSHDRRHSRGQDPRKPASRGRGIDAHGLLALQRAAGNQAVGLVVQRQPAAGTSTVKIGKHTINVTGGNLAKWAAKEVPEWLEVTSEKDGHSTSLDRLARKKTQIDSLKLTTPAAKTKGKEGEFLANVWYEITISNGRIKSYQVNGGTESWRVSDFTDVNFHTITRGIGQP